MLRLLVRSILRCGPAAGIALCLAVSAARGGEALRLTHDGTLKFSPVFVGEGREVVYAMHESPNLVALQRLKLEGGASERMHPSVVAHQLDPAFNASGRWH